MEGAISPEFIGQEIAMHSSKTDIGAHHIFLGQVRGDIIMDRKVKAIRYTSYEPMVMEKMKMIREVIFEKYPLNCLHVYHSLGIVETGKISLMVFASSKHRKESIEACQEMVEKIKFELPIWGEEILEDDKILWKKNQ